MFLSGRFHVQIFIVLSILAFISSAQPALSSDTGVAAHFVSKKQLHGFSKPWKSSGCFAVAPNAGLVWSIKTPFPSRIELGENGIQNVSADGHVQRMNASALPAYQALRTAMIAALLGEWQNLSPVFHVSRQDVSDGYVVHLQPRDQSGRMPLKRLTVSGGDHVEKVGLVNMAGDVDQITFTKHRKLQADTMADLIHYVEKCN